MSDSFRDLERPEAARRKEAVLMAAISALECLDHPSRQDLARFSRLFIPLYAAASTQARRTASATLSRLRQVPDDVAEMLVNEPIAIAAPFIAHYQPLKESVLARAVATHGAPHARAAARRQSLSKEALAALRSLNDPSVEGLLILRGLVRDPALRDENAPQAAEPARPDPAARPAPVIRSAPPARPLVDAPPLDPSERLRAQLKAMALRDPAAEARARATSPDTKAPAQTSARTPAPAERPGRRAAPQALNRPTSSVKRPHVQAETQPVGRESARRRVVQARLAQLERYAKPDQESWFATALADAMEASFALAERIMMDVSGRQLATALIALRTPEPTIRAALESFFPHLQKPSQRHSLATDLIEELDAESCAARLAAWQRADQYTHGAATHVPALADSKPVRREASQRTQALDTRRAARSRKAG